MKTKIIILIFLTWVTFSLNAQTIVRQVISPIGLSTNSSGNYISHTVGQPTPPGTASAPKVVLRQGFEQPPKPKSKPIDINTVILNIFPNPNDGIFNLTVETVDNNSYTFEIYDAIGKLIQIGDGETNVEKMITLPKGVGRAVYIIKVKTIIGNLGEGKVIVIG